MKLGLPAEVLARHIDVIDVRNGAEKTWDPVPITIATYNLGSARSDGARASLGQQFSGHGLDVVFTQENRDRSSFAGVYNDSWWMAASQADDVGNFGCG